MREALRALELVVVIDIAMTETARAADYVLPASTQFEKWEATFFNFEFPENYFHLRKPLFAPLGDSLSEAEIHCRLLEALAICPRIVEELRALLQKRAAQRSEIGLQRPWRGRYRRQISTRDLIPHTRGVLPEAAEGQFFGHWHSILRYGTATAWHGLVTRAMFSNKPINYSTPLLPGTQASSSPKTTWKPWGRWVTSTYSACDSHATRRTQST